MTKVVVVPPPENPPECFATGKQPLGYDPAETECRQSCPDKVSCLPLALEKKIYKKGTAPAPDVDHEINVVRSGIVPLDAVLARMKLRRDAIAKFRKEKGDDAALPADLFSPEIRVEAKFEQEAQAPAKPPRQTKKEKAAEKQPDLPVASETKDEQTAPSSEAATTDDTAAEGAGAADAETETTETTTTETEGTETDMSKNKGKKSASKKATKAATKKAPPPPTKAAAKSKGKPATKKAASTPRKRATVTKKDGREIVCGRKLPAPTEGLNTERMAASLKRIKIGAPFHLDIGMTITKKMRDGDLVITVEKTGYRLKKDGKLYSSLSGAVMNATKRLASCNEFFNVEKNKNVEITGKGVPKGKYTSADA